VDLYLLWVIIEPNRISHTQPEKKKRVYYYQKWTRKERKKRGEEEEKKVEWMAVFRVFQFCEWKVKSSSSSSQWTEKRTKSSLLYCCVSVLYMCILQVKGHSETHVNRASDYPSELYTTTAQCFTYPSTEEWFEEKDCKLL
jgi:hypothetical protein